MANALFVELAQTAFELLTEFGSEGVLLREPAAPADTYDPETGTTTPAAAVAPLTITACVFPITAKLVDGTLIKETDEIAYVSAVGLEGATTTDKMVFGGATYTIVKPTRLSPDGATTVLHTWVVRK